MSRLIDADVLKKAFDFDEDVELECSVVHYGIDHAKTVNAIPVEWILCKDKLPENEQKCLVTMFAGELTFVDIATYVPKSGRWVVQSLASWGNVVAWMPLPEPITYKEVR